MKRIIDLKRYRKTMMWILGIIIGLFVAINIVAYLFIHQSSFGRLPSGKRKERIVKSSDYRNGQFRNRVDTPQLTEGVTFVDIVTDRICNKVERLTPADRIPSVKTDLRNLDPNQNILIWLGHSSYFIQIDSKRILIDPVLCGHASPLSSMLKAFPGSDIYKAEDMPAIDYLIVTHDHWDHLDYATVTSLKDRIGMVVCSLGVGEHFERWGFDNGRVVEMEWDEDHKLQLGFTISCLTTRHFAGRSQKRNTSLWVSYLLQTPSMKIYIGGDGGYGKHFARIGERFGEIDLALLENGQYDRKWKYIHCQPDEVIRVAGDLRAKSFIPGHSGKFALAGHSWDEPLQRVSKAYQDALLDSVMNYKPRICTPMIGQPVYLRDTAQVFSMWWVGLK